MYECLVQHCLITGLGTCVLLPIYLLFYKITKYYDSRGNKNTWKWTL